jgi:hypothetical protein
VATNITGFGNVRNALWSLRNAPNATNTIPNPIIKVTVGNALIVAIHGRLSNHPLHFVERWRGTIYLKRG